MKRARQKRNPAESPRQGQPEELPAGRKDPTENPQSIFVTNDNKQCWKIDYNLIFS